MRKQGKFGLAAALLLAVPSFAWAQRAPGASVSPSRAVPSAAAVAPQVVPAFRSASAPSSSQMHAGNRVAGTHVTRATGSNGGSNFVSNGGSNAGSSNAGFAGDPISLQQLLDPYPAYGFDFEHLNAINRDLEMKAFIDPATQMRIATAERRLRHSPRAGTGSGFYVLDGGGAYAIPDDSSGDVNVDQGEAAGQAQQGDDQAAQGQQAQGTRRAQQPIIIIQQPSAEQPAGESNGAPEAQEEAASLRDVGQFTLVTRDGMEIEAVAFTRVKDKLVYITSEGARYTLALRDLDSDETVRVNQERGTPLQLPL
jgi:hypothetical protein